MGESTRDLATDRTRAGDEVAYLEAARPALAVVPPDPTLARAVGAAPDQEP